MIRTSLVIGLVLLASAASVAQEPFAPWHEWRVGDLFKIGVASNPDQSSQTKQGRVFLVVQRQESVGGFICWKMFFNPDVDLGDQVRCFLYIDKQAGALRK